MGEVEQQEKGTGKRGKSKSSRQGCVLYYWCAHMLHKEKGIEARDRRAQKHGGGGGEGGGMAPAPHVAVHTLAGQTLTRDRQSAAERGFRGGRPDGSDGRKLTERSRGEEDDTQGYGSGTGDVLGAIFG